MKSLSHEMREIHRRLTELKKENEELKLLLSLTGKTPHDYETKVNNPFRSFISEFFVNLDRRSREKLQRMFIQTSQISRRNSFITEEFPAKFSFHTDV